jgi:hypothetical protein
MSLKRLIFAASTAGAIGSVAACGDPLALTPATQPNRIDTVTIFALEGTPISSPSGYDVVFNVPARTDRAAGFDFTFDIDSGGTSLIFPTGALGLGLESGIVFSDKEFTQIDIAPTEDYNVDSAMVVHQDTVFIVRSRPDVAGCPIFLGALPRYGKFEILNIDPQARSITMMSLVNVNCGYRGLELGLPTQ